MQIGLSGRAFVHFLIFELLLVGLLAMIGQVPPWLWFVASALLLAALWTHDHRMQLAALMRRTPPTRLVIVGLAAGLTCMLGGGLLTFALLYPKRADEAKQATVQTQPAQKADAFNQSLLAVAAVATESRHDPLRLTVTIANTGRLPTLKGFIGMDVIVSETDLEVTKGIAPLFEERSRKEADLGHLTLVPGQLFHLTLWHAAVTKQVYDDFMVGKKFVYVLLVADYTDPATPDGKRRVMEFAIRPANPLSGVDPMKNWSLVRQRSYLQE